MNNIVDFLAQRIDNQENLLLMVAGHMLDDKHPDRSSVTYRISRVVSDGKEVLSRDKFALFKWKTVYTIKIIPEEKDSEGRLSPILCHFDLKKAKSSNKSPVKAIVSEIKCFLKEIKRTINDQTEREIEEALKKEIARECLLLKLKKSSKYISSKVGGFTKDIFNNKDRLHMYNFSVIDQNYLQHEELKQILNLSREGEHFVITDTAMMEMMKNGAKTYEWSLKIISDYRDKIYISLSPSEILKNELTTKVPCENVISIERTNEFHKILHEINAGIYGTTRAKADANIPFAIQSVAENQLNHKRNKAVLINRYKAISDDLGSYCCKGLRKGLIEKELEYKYVIKAVVKSMKTDLSDNGFTNKEMDAFIKKDSFLFRQKALFGWRGMDWIKKGGLESLQENNATNDLMDLDYIVIATYGKGILSKEKWVKPAYEEMQDIINLHIKGG